MSFKGASFGERTLDLFRSEARCLLYNYGTCTTAEFGTLYCFEIDKELPVLSLVQYTIHGLRCSTE